MNMQRKLGLAGVLGVAVALGGCFGDDDDEAPARPVLTTAPTQGDIGGSPGNPGTSGDLVAYVQRLIGADSAEADLAEPVDISGIDPQTTDSEDPKDI